jgi:hypothetical protein
MLLKWVTVGRLEKEIRSFSRKIFGLETVVYPLLTGIFILFLMRKIALLLVFGMELN